MIVNEWVEPYTLMMGVHMMDVMIEVMCTSGLVYAPFAIAIITSIVEALTQGEDEGNAGELAVKFLRKKTLIMMPVFLLAFIPMKGSGVTFDSRVVSYSCDAAAQTQGAVSNSQQQLIGNFSNAKTMVPLFWLLVHDYASTLTNIAIASMPCAADIKMAKTNLEASNLESPADQQLASSWKSACLDPALGSYVNSNVEYSDSLWAGSSELRRIYSQDNNFMEVPLETAQAIGLYYSPEDISGSSVRVNCDAIYSHIETAAVLSAKSTAKSSWKVFTEALGLTGVQDKKRAAVEMVAKVSVGKQISLSSNIENVGDVITSNIDEYSGLSISGMLAKFTASIGVAVGNILKAPDVVVQKNTLPLNVCMYQMLLLSVIPILLVLSGFDITTCFSLAALYFGLEFTLVFGNLATWVDNTLSAFFYSSGSSGLLAALSSSGSAETVSMFQQAILTNVQNTSYQVLPNVWMMTLAYVGAKGGTQMMSSASSSANQIASQLKQAIDATKNVNRSVSQGAVSAGRKAADRLKKGANL